MNTSPIKYMWVGKDSNAKYVWDSIASRRIWVKTKLAKRFRVLKSELARSGYKIVLISILEGPSRSALKRNSCSDRIAEAIKDVEGDRQ